MGSDINGGNVGEHTVVHNDGTAQANKVVENGGRHDGNIPHARGGGLLRWHSDGVLRGAEVVPAVLPGGGLGALYGPCLWASEWASHGGPEANGGAGGGDRVRHRAQRDHHHHCVFGGSDGTSSQAVGKGASSWGRCCSWGGSLCAVGRRREA